jgi:hypothetical protein
LLLGDKCNSCLISIHRHVPAHSICKYT